MKNKDFEFLHSSLWNKYSQKKISSIKGYKI